MTNYTQEQLDTLERAQSREGKTTPAPWMQYNPHRAWGMYYADCLKFQNEKVIFCNSVWDTSPTRLGSETSENLSLVTDAPALQDLALAQANIITEQAARIAALEAFKLVVKRLDNGMWEYAIVRNDQWITGGEAKHENIAYALGNALLERLEKSAQP